MRFDPQRAPPGPGEGVSAVVEHTSAAAFLERAGPWLREREDHHNLILDFAQGAAAPGGGDPEALFVTVEERGLVNGCVVRLAPHQALTTALTTALSPAAPLAVASLLARRLDRLPGVVGPRHAALAIAGGWVALRGGAVREGMRQGLHRLDRVTPSRRSAGRMRLASSDDAVLALRWCEAFASETGIAHTVSESTLARWLEGGALHIWEAGGEPAAMAVAQGRTPRGIRIGFVFTPPPLRGRGHASGLVGALSQHMLDRGCRFCVLYTDLANPTSNALYRRLGYEMIGEVVDVHLTDTGTR